MPSLPAAWTTVSEETGVSLSNMNGGSALNYLLLGLVNILWIPTAMKIGRRPVLLITTLICTSSAVWQGNFTGTAQWMLANVLNGVGTSAYQAVIQLCVFDMFFVHERGRGLAYYLFGQQLGSILGLITGGSIADGPGWRWSQYIVAIIDASVFVLLFCSFEETMFPRFLFQSSGPTAAEAATGPAESTNQPNEGSENGKAAAQSTTVDAEIGENFPDIPKRTFSQRLKLWTYYPQDATTWYQYFRRPLFLFAFPNVVIVRLSSPLTAHKPLTDAPQPGFIFAFGCTAGIVSFNTSLPPFPSRPHPPLTSLPHSLRNPHGTPLQLEHHLDRPSLPRRPHRQHPRLGHRRPARRRPRPRPRPPQRRRQGARDASLGALPQRAVRRARLLPVRLGRAGGRALADGGVWRRGDDCAAGERVCSGDGICDGLLPGGECARSCVLEEGAC